MYMKTVLHLAAFTLIVSSVASAQTKLTLQNPSFEDGLAGWSCADNGMSQAIPAAARNNSKNGLRVTDADDKNGSSAYSSPLPATAGKKYRLTFWGRNNQGEGLAVYLVFFDAQGKQLNNSALKNENLTILSKDTADWKQYTLEGVAPADSATVKVWVHSFGAAKVTGDIDDLELSAL